MYGMPKGVTDKKAHHHQSLKTIIMATKVNTQITHKLSTAKANYWNSKRRYR